MENEQPLMTGRMASRIFLVCLVLCATGLVFFVYFPLIEVLVLAVLLRIVIYPLYVRLLSMFQGRKNLASLILVISTALVIVIVFSLFALILSTQIFDLTQRMKEVVDNGQLKDLSVHPLVIEIVDTIRKILPTWANEQLNFAESFSQLIKTASTYMLNKGANFLGSMMKIITHFFIMIFLLFFLIRDGASMIRSLKTLVPLTENQEDQIIDKVRGVTRAILIGVVLTALLQGLVGGIGLALVGLPGFILGTLMGLASLVPVVGTGLVGIPAVLYLLILGKWISSIFLVLWLMIIVGSIDNYIRPVLMGGKARISPFFIFLSIVGGLAVFGLSGIIYGPLITGFAAVVLYVYRVEFSLKNPMQEQLDEFSGQNEDHRKA